jgi:hypothetical protein
MNGQDQFRIAENIRFAAYWRRGVRHQLKAQEPLLPVVPGLKTEGQHTLAHRRRVQITGNMLYFPRNSFLRNSFLRNSFLRNSFRERRAAHEARAFRFSDQGSHKGCPYARRRVTLLSCRAATRAAPTPAARYLVEATTRVASMVLLPALRIERPGPRS